MKQRVHRSRYGSRGKGTGAVHARLLAAQYPGTEALMRWVKFALVAGLAVWTIQFARTPLSDDAMDSFLHLPDLVFHEAGHIIFSPFGRFMTVLGGSLMQVLVPVDRRHRIRAAGGSVQRRDLRHGGPGQNLVDLAPYIADARALQLILLGGHTGAEVEGHDWEFILTQLGVTHLDHQIGMTALRDRPADHDRLARDRRPRGAPQLGVGFAL